MSEQATTNEAVPPIPGQIQAPADEPLDDIEIEIPPEDGDPEPELAAEPSAEPPRKRGPKRYSELTRQRDEATQAAETFRRMAEEERAARIAAQSDATESKKVAMQSYEASTTTQLAAAEAAYETAHIGGDPKVIAKSASDLAAARQAHEDAKAWVKAEPAAPQQQQQQPQPQPQAQEQVPSPVVLSFLKDNDWFDVFQRHADGRFLRGQNGQPVANPNFDPDMHNEAMLAHGKAIRMIQSGKVTWKAESPDYFKFIADHVATEFPDAFEDVVETAPARPQMQRAPARVAGVPRTAAAAPAAASPTKVKLSGEQLKFIENMVNNGGGPKYPKGHAKQFQPMSLDDARISYARQYLRQKADGKLTQEQQ